MKTAIVAVIFAMTSALSFSQEARVAQPSDQLIRRVQAKNLALSGDIAGAERVLLGSTDSKASVASNHYSTAQKLTRLATEMSHSGKVPEAMAIARRALQYLAEAERVAGADRGLRASIWRQAGFINERLLADPSSAHSNYARASELLPDSKTAKEAVNRLSAAVATRNGKE